MSAYEGISVVHDIKLESHPERGMCSLFLVLFPTMGIYIYDGGPKYLATICRATWEYDQLLSKTLPDLEGSEIR